MPRTRLPRRPSYRQLVLALRAAAKCLRIPASEWPDIPGRTRLVLLRCAERAERMVAQAGDGSDRSSGK